jgi:hypothetical protein
MQTARTYDSKIEIWLEALLTLGGEQLNEQRVESAPSRDRGARGWLRVVGRPQFQQMRDEPDRAGELHVEPVELETSVN